jgi:predicted SnoaL-like aldol condensation-catalyzing enzyme
VPLRHLLHRGARDPTIRDNPPPLLRCPLAAPPPHYRLRTRFVYFVWLRHRSSPRRGPCAASERIVQVGEFVPGASATRLRYTQHNLAVADGLAGLGALLRLTEGSAKVNTIRVFQDGDCVFTHTDYDFFGPKIGFDIFRFENGLIVEHWDNLQEKPTAPNPSGHTMLDGPTQATDLGNNQANKVLVRAFVDNILVTGKMDKLAGYFAGDNYIQHNPQIADGLSGRGAALEAMASQGVTMKYDRIHKVLGEGNCVLVVSEGSFGGRHTSFYDLFRVEKGKIAEHWDTIETIPPRERWKNSNGKF